MAVFWFFGLLMGAAFLLFGTYVAHWSLAVSLIAAVIGVVFWGILLAGVVTWIRRWLVMTNRINETQDPSRRSSEINRYLFWRRFILVAAVLAVLAVLAGVLFALKALGPVLVALLIMPVYFLTNFLTLFGPFVLFSRMGRETLLPGDANYGVRMDDVRGQSAAVDEMRRILALIEQGRHYVRAGGKRERGVLMVGPPGTGKTLLAKAIATQMRSPLIVSSGAAYQGMFVGMDMLAVWLAVRRAKQLARRWGGCILFIDEFDALGQRRPGGGGMLSNLGGGAQLGLNMLLVQMDGVDNAGSTRRSIRRFFNMTLDGLFLPRKFLGFIPMRLPTVRPTQHNILFLGATNRPKVLDEAVTRPGRFGRTIVFHMPSRADRMDIADLYFGQKAHDPDLDRPERREEFARITEGYSGAMIEQALSLALMYAFEEGRSRFEWRDLRRSMGNIEAGLTEMVTPSQPELVATARHELGHVIASLYYLPDQVSTRLSVMMRGNALGHHRSTATTEQFSKMRSQCAGELRHLLGAIASERVFYGENGNGVTQDLVDATRLASLMTGAWAMGPDAMDTKRAKLAVNLGEHLISRVEVTQGLGEGNSVVSAVLDDPRSRRVVAQLLGSAYIDDWRLMYVNQAAIDRAVDELIGAGELVGDEISRLLASIGLRMPTPADPEPAPQPPLPDLAAEDMPRLREASV
ncbi:MAG TPA: AAA family ATPase [Candidatus Dormibacteraeota bacterium]|jgi:cell division protease FtsH|nr:AAA family ATPase [Candidatus Dormibacteraeota bacterium]